MAFGGICLFAQSDVVLFWRPDCGQTVIYSAYTIRQSAAVLGQTKTLVGLPGQNA
jgi:predicted RNA-binding Zn-ribbon protein involved in translation (DUF1610 family)